MLVGWCERVLKLPNLTKLCSNASKQMGICAMMHNGFITFLKSHFPSKHIFKDNFKKSLASLCTSHKASDNTVFAATIECVA